MKVTQPQSVPEGDSWSAGMIVSTAAERKASSSGVSTSLASGAAGAFEAVVAASGVQAARPVAAAAALAPATPAPFRNSRRGSLMSAIDTSRRKYVLGTRTPLCLACPIAKAYSDLRDEGRTECRSWSPHGNVLCRCGGFSYGAVLWAASSWGRLPDSLSASWERCSAIRRTLSIFSVLSPGFLQ